MDSFFQELIIKGESAFGTGDLGLINEAQVAGRIEKLKER